LIFTLTLSPRQRRASPPRVGKLEVYPPPVGLPASGRERAEMRGREGGAP